MNPALLIAGVVALVIGAVFVAPNLLAAMGRAAAHTPVASRIALRDLSRYRARSATGLAAIGLAIAIPTTVLVVAAANRHTAGEGNLSDRELLIRIGDDALAIPARTADQLGELQAVIDTVTARINARATPLQVAVDPTETTSRGSETLQPAVVLARRVDDNTSRDLDVLYLATPPVLALTNRPANAADQTVDVLTAERGTLAFANTATREPPTTATTAKAAYSSEPNSLITPAGLARHRWIAVPAGWLLRADQPVSADARQPAPVASPSRAHVAGPLLAVGSP